MVIYEDPRRVRAQQAAGPRDAGRDQDHTSISTGCSTGSPTSAGGPSSSTGSTRTRRARCWWRGRARSAGHFAKAFSGRTARKVYWALVVGVPDCDEGVIDAPLAKQPGTGGEKMHVSEEHGLPAKTRWRVIDRAGNRAAWVELQPLTGRTHQLRAHMAAIGHPIVGDAKYGGPEAFLTGGISRKLHLHARRIRIDAPDGGEIDVTAELPAHFAESLATLGFEPMAGDTLPLEQPAPRRPRRSSARSPPRPRRGAASGAGERRVARLADRRRSGGEPARDLRLRRDAGRQRRDHLSRARGELRAERARAAAAAGLRAR